MNSFFSFIYNYRVPLFYGFIILLLILNRKKFEVQAKIIFLLRTNFGLKTINKIGTKYKEQIRLLGLIGIGVGFVGLILISGLMVKAGVDLFIKPDAPAAVQPIIPGVNIPGSTFKIPLVMPWIALFIIVLIHEFSHGIVAVANKIKIKNTGIVFFGPLMGAFVEPDEEKLKKENDVTQYSIYAAGPFSNVILAGLVILFMLFVLSPLTSVITTQDGIYFQEIINNTPAQIAGLEPDMIITSFNDKEIKNSDELLNYLSKEEPGDTIKLGSENQSYYLTLSESPDNPSQGYMGVLGVKTNTVLKNDNSFYRFLQWFLKILGEQLFWIYVLSLGIGLANLLPLGPVDGGRMIQTASRKIAGDEKRGDYIWSKITYVAFLILILLLFTPILRTVFNNFFG